MAKIMYKNTTYNSDIGSIVIDTSSSSPFDTRELGAELSKLSVELVDSPITQEKLHDIDNAGATLMVGSDSPSALERVLPVLKDMSKHVFSMGGLGAGHTMKTLNNYVSVGSIIALNDALVFYASTATCQATRLITIGHRPKTWPQSANNDRRTQRRHRRQLLNLVFDEEPQVV